MPRYLADTSTWHRRHATSAIAERWGALVELDEVALCAPVELELLYSARSPRDYAARRDELGGLPQLPLDQDAAVLARRTQAALAERNQHRGPTPVDLLIAAIAEANDVVLLHHDRHFDAIRRVTRQPMEWLPRRTRG